MEQSATEKDKEIEFKTTKFILKMCVLCGDIKPNALVGLKVLWKDILDISGVDIQQSYDYAMGCRKCINMVLKFSKFREKIIETENFIKKSLEAEEEREALRNKIKAAEAQRNKIQQPTVVPQPSDQPVPAQSMEQSQENQEQEETEPENFECNFCFESFPKVKEVLRHEKKHEIQMFPAHNTQLSGMRQLICELCGDKYIHLRPHLIAKHKNEKDKCPFCKEDIPIEFFQKHVDDHALCDICGKEIRRSKYSSHLERHESKHSVLCPVCKRPFKCKQHMRRHLETHSGKKPHRCPFCERTFNRHSNLNVHKRLHLNIKPYKCEHCNASFHHNVSLKRHQFRKHNMVVDAKF